MRKTTFNGANVFMSRNLVPPEVFASLHDVLKDNGAEIILCSDPSRPLCVFSCAKENRMLPKQGFTCCLAMDGVKILASGFELEAKVEIGKLVTAMGGMMLNKASSDVDFVIAKNVLAAKYKWALNTLKKPIVLESWLQQCWKEHRVVPHESYRVPPFSGLTISVTQVPPAERKEIEELIIQNGGRYSAELTKKITHLCLLNYKHAPEGDKYKVAKRWGHLHIVTRAWFNHSVARRACLNEESYPVQKSLATSANSHRNSLKAQHNQNKVVRNSQCGPHSTTHQEISCDGVPDADVETTLSQNMASTISDVSVPVSEDCTPPCMQPNSSMNIDNCVAEDSLSDDNDLYLLNCKIHIVGFDASEMRKLVNMVRRGGGSRYMSLNEQLTHIVVGNPSESEKKEVRSLSAMGVINVVRTVWLEDCERQKKEVPVHRRHVAYDLLLPKDTLSSNKGSVSTMSGPKQGKPTSIQPTFPNNQFQSSSKGQQKMQHSISKKSQEIKSSVFRGRSFRFSSSFPDDQRPEVVDWIQEGGGEVVDTQGVKNVDYTVESHGVLCSPAQFSGVTNVSAHWIRSCLQDGHLLDISSHILFSPLQCKVPLPGFEGLRFCVSQYEEKDRQLLRNLCHVLGGRLNNNLTKKINYLICKFSEGPKYEAACRYGMQSVTIEWIWECVKQSKIVASSQFLPKEATNSDREAGVCITSQYPTQAVRMISTAGASQLTSQSEDPKIIDGQVDVIKIRKEVKYSAVCSKKPRLSEDGNVISALSSRSSHKDTVCSIISTDDKFTENGGDVSKSVPDVASAIEDLLEQTSKIHDQNSPERTTIDKNISEGFTSDCSRLGLDLNSEDPHSAFGLSKHWTRSSKSDENPGGEENAGIYGGFSETQTESQVVSYEEDLSGRQKIIDKARTRSGLTPNPSLT
ncbi:BRCT domain-containing protein [Artemisia annua]|uniref:BRCT domain-containing protein n=1 Tax=Artemisia annua TaxID=35608 RepID=A0A2U1N5X5_ARTAN|nr:BRCT domain-containing protein [Artemisia annua]